MTNNGASHNAPAGGVVEIRGLLGAVAWGPDYRVTRVALFTDQEGMYEIEIDDNNKALTKSLCKVVVVKGELVKSQGGMESLRVMEFWPSA